MPKVEFFIYNEIDGSTSKKEAALLEFCLTSLLIFGYFSKKLAIILPFEHVQKSFHSGERLKGQLHLKIDHWTPFSLSEEEFNQLVKSLMNEENWNITDTPNPEKIIYDKDLNSDFTTYETWYRSVCKKHLDITEFSQFLPGFTYEIFYKDRLVGNFLCSESRRNSKFKGTFIANDKYPYSLHKSVKHTVGERLEPLDLYNFEAEDTYSIRRSFKFMFLTEKRINFQRKRTMYFQTIFP